MKQVSHSSASRSLPHLLFGAMLLTATVFYPVEAAISSGESPRKNIQTIDAGSIRYVTTVESPHASSDSATEDRSEKYVSNASSGPQIDNATYYADNGVGSVTRIELYYNSPLQDTELPDSLILYWPDQTGEVRTLGRDLLIIDPVDSSHVTGTLSPPFSPGQTQLSESASDLGASYRHNPLTPDTPATVTHFRITDGVGPLLKEAFLQERLYESDNTLILTFSEPLNPATSFGRQLQLIRQGTADTVEVIILEIISLVNDSTVTVQAAPADNANRDVRVNAGDQLRLIPGSSGGTLADLDGNTAHDMNRPVIVGFRPGAAAIAGAWYVDSDADGIINEVRVKFRRTVEQSELDTISVQWEHRVFRFPSSACIRVSDSLFAIDLGGSISTVTTGGAMYISVAYGAVPGVYRTATAFDSAAPVLISLLYTFGTDLYTFGTEPSDTLTARYSEPLKQPPAVDRPFNFYSSSADSEYTVKVASLGGKDATHRFIIREKYPDNVAPQWKYDTIRVGDPASIDMDSLKEYIKIPRYFLDDSAWINTDADPMSNAVDLEGNPQIDDRNKRIGIDFELLQPRLVFIDTTESASREENRSGCGGCGTGTVLAFIPPLFFFARIHLRRRQKPKP
ncbi:MAG: hypothetical protein JXA18_02445 [Chitinispirillaceae bacterium]|nr:hypothetical protein [Chitinispirillaceae bacterium]